MSIAVRKQSQKQKKPRRTGLKKSLYVGLIGLMGFIGLMGAAGCSPANMPYGMTRHSAGLDYTEGNFCAEVRGTYTRQEGDGYTGSPGKTGESLTDTPRALAAEVQVTQTDGEQVLRVLYTQPETLAGMAVESRSTIEGTAAATVTVTVTLDDLSVSATDGRYDRLLLPAMLLLGAGDITAVGKDSEGMRTVTLSDTASGTETTLHFVTGEILPALAEGAGEGWRMTVKVSPGLS